MMMTNDLISRQDAIEVLSVMQGVFTEYGVRKGISMAWQQIKSLPSAQPEIIRCKDCKHFEYDHLYIIQGIPVLGHEVCNAWSDGCKTDENGYCFMAERRTDE